MCFFYFLIFQIMSGLTSRAGEKGRRRGARAKATTTQVPCDGCARAASFSKRKCIEHTGSAWVRNLLLKIGVGTLSGLPLSLSCIISCATMRRTSHHLSFVQERGVICNRLPMMKFQWVCMVGNNNLHHQHHLCSGTVNLQSMYPHLIFLLFSPILFHTVMIVY